MTARPVQHLHALDSLRGLAAFTVMLSHFYLLWFYTWNPQTALRHLPFVYSLCIYPLIAGHEAVILFFVLSGFVLSLPYHAATQLPYRQFAARRIVRVYGPYLAAILVSFACVLHWHGDLAATHGPWALGMWSGTFDAALALQHVLFLGTYDTRFYDFVIWTLIHEMRISLVLPFVLILLGGFNRYVYVVFAGACTTAAVLVLTHHPDVRSWIGSLMLTCHYIGFFVIGALYAKNLQSVRIWFEARSRFHRVALLLLSLACYYQGHRIEGVLLPRGCSPTVSAFCADWVIALGVVGVIAISLHSRTASAILTRRLPLFLGKISYSLYLLHPLVLLALTFTLGNRVSLWIQAPVYLLLCISLSYVFYLLVEGPCISLSRKIGRRRIAA